MGNSTNTKIADMFIDALWERWPDTLPLFIRHAMACPGCYLARFESLKNALAVYDISTEAFFESLEKIIEKENYDGRTN